MTSPGEREFRKKLERVVGPLSASHWAVLIAEERVADCLNDTYPFEDLVADVRAWRRAARLEAGLLRPNEVAVPAGERLEAWDTARSLLAMSDADAEGAVTAFRARVLRETLIDLGGVEDWVSEHAGSRELDELVAIGRDLASRLPWDASEAQAFVLTGRAPRLRSIKVTRHIPGGGRPPRVSFNLEVDVEVTPDELAEAYGQARRHVLAGRYRRPSLKSLRLAAFAAARRPHSSWGRIREAWNAANPTERYETEARGFAGNVRPLLQRIRTPPVAINRVLRESGVVLRRRQHAARSRSTSAKRGGRSRRS